MAIAIYRMVKKHQTKKTEQTQVFRPTPCPHRISALSPNLTQDNVSPDITSQTDREKKCSTCQREKRATRKYRYKLLFCLFPVFLLGSLDFTIVATALPFIASTFDKLNQLNWIVTAFTLTSTAFIPIFGQLADTFGRHATLQFTVAVLTIGSILCAVTPLWGVLLLGRSLQGIGTAGVQNVCMLALADGVSLKEQALNTSIFSFLNGIGYAIGPLIGGYLTNANWRYCFVVCIGLGVISFGTVFILRKDLKQGRVSLFSPAGEQSRFEALLDGLSSLDFGGIILFIFGVGLIILGTAWGGSTFPWTSAAVIVSLVLGVIFLVLFIAYEYMLEPGRFLQMRLPQVQPLIPFNLFQAKDIRIICLLAAATGAALYSVFYFVGIYFTLVEAYPASKAGLQLLYYTPGLGVGVYAAVYLCNIKPRQTFWPLFIGTLIETGGMAVVTYAVKARQVTLINVMMAVAGAGTGARFMPLNLHLTGMFHEQLAAAFSLVRFAMPFGGTLALTIMGSVFQNKMSAYFGSTAVNNGISISPGNALNGTAGVNLHSQAALDSISKLPAAQQAVVRATGADATMWAFVSILPILAIGMIASMGLGNVWISRKSVDDAENVREQSSKSTSSGDSELPEKQAPAITGDNPLTSTPSPELVHTVKPTSKTGHGGKVFDGIYLIGLFKGTVRTQRRTITT